MLMTKGYKDIKGWADLELVNQNLGWQALGMVNSSLIPGTYHDHMSNEFPTP